MNIETHDRVRLKTYTPKLYVVWLLSAARNVEPHAPALAGLLTRICEGELARRRSLQTDTPLDVEPPDMTEIVGWSDQQLAESLVRSGFLVRMSRSMPTDTATFLADLHGIICSVIATRLRDARY